MKYVLRGAAVTFDPRLRVVKRAHVAISDRKLVFVGSSRRTLPEAFRNTPLVDVDGYIYPGLIDLHNNLSYTFLGLWSITRKFLDRDQWRGQTRYKREIRGPAELLALANPELRFSLFHAADGFPAGVGDDPSDLPS